MTKKFCRARWDREAGFEVAIKVIDLENVEDDITDIHRVRHLHRPPCLSHPSPQPGQGKTNSSIWMQEVAVLAECRSANITEYYASVMLPGTTELLIIMELMASSVNDLVRTSPLSAIGECKSCPRRMLATRTTLA